MKQTAFRMTEEDLVILDEAKRRTGLHTRVDALRYLLRFWADKVKVDVDALTSKAPKRKRSK